MVLFDTNMILRYLLNDNQEMADKAEAYLDAGNIHGRETVWNRQSFLSLACP